jgi:hypothetical protein
MSNSCTKLFYSDIKAIAHKLVLLCALLSPVIITLFLIYLYPLFSRLARYEAVHLYERYYSVTAITLISSVPFIYGLLFSFTHMKGSYTPGNNIPDTAKKVVRRDLIWRIFYSASLSFITVLPVIYLTNAVSSEGWLRSIYASILMGVSSPFIFLLSIRFGGENKKINTGLLICFLFLITVPIGLLLHHPWNYIAFFSPFYWSSWAWVIASPAESMIYGMISMAITAVYMLIFIRTILLNAERV